MSVHQSAEFMIMGTLERFEEKVTSSGAQFILISVSVPNQRGSKAWYNVSLFEEQREAFLRLKASVGELVHITGRLGYRKMAETGPDGVRKDVYNLNLYTENVEKVTTNDV